MKIINASTGKIGFSVIGPKQFLNHDIRFGEIALCIARDSENANQPSVWLLGGIDRIEDYLHLASAQNAMSDEDKNLLLVSLDDARKKMPKTSIQRLANYFSLTAAEMIEASNLAQICISNTIDGVKNYANSEIEWSPGSNDNKVQ